jgi:SAM-dependent methyltransferase
MLVLLIDIGHTLGLFEAAAGAGPLTPEELADRAGVDARNVAEWLGAMATGGLFTLDPASGRYELTDAMAMVLTGDGPENLARLACQPIQMAGVVPEVTQAVRTGSGVPYAVYMPEFAETMDMSRRPLYEYCALDYLACAPGLLDRFTSSGGRALDVGCGRGRFTLAIATALPKLEAVGFDLDGPTIERANADAKERGLENARFDVADAVAFAVDPPWDLITAFDAIHDQADPLGVLRRIREALAPGGVFLMVDVRAETDVADNLDHPMGPWLYGISVMHCLQVSLAGGGPGLGTCWGRQQAHDYLREAGFDEVEEARVARDRANIVYVCR